MMVAAYPSEDMTNSLEGITTLITYLNQYSTDGIARPFKHRRIFGMDAVEAETALFTRKKEGIEYEEIPLPRYMDRDGRLCAEVKRKGFCYVEENVVMYNETAERLEDR